MRIYAKVRARSSRNKIEKISDQEYKIWTTAAPVNNQANEKIIQLLADFFDVPKSQIEIVGGKTVGHKIIDIHFL